MDQRNGVTKLQEQASHKNRNSFHIDSLLEKRQRKLLLASIATGTSRARSHHAGDNGGTNGVGVQASAHTAARPELKTSPAVGTIGSTAESPIIPEEPFFPPTDPSPSSPSSNSTAHSCATWQKPINAKPARVDDLPHGLANPANSNWHMPFMALLFKLSRESAIGNKSAGDFKKQTQVSSGSSSFMGNEMHFQQKNTAASQQQVDCTSYTTTPALPFFPHFPLANSYARHQALMALMQQQQQQLSPALRGNVGMAAYMQLLQQQSQLFQLAGQFPPDARKPLQGSDSGKHPNKTPSALFPQLPLYPFASNGEQLQSTSKNPTTFSMPSRKEGEEGALKSSSMKRLAKPSFGHRSGRNSLVGAVTTASNIKKYRCDICSKTFSRSNTLITHKRIHTGEKPFRCEHCGRAFRQPGNLTRHAYTHTTVKPFVCEECGKAFNRASNLSTHMKVHGLCAGRAME